MTYQSPNEVRSARRISSAGSSSSTGSSTGSSTCSAAASAATAAAGWASSGAGAESTASPVASSVTAGDSAPASPYSGSPGRSSSAGRPVSSNWDTQELAFHSGGPVAGPGQVRVTLRRTPR